MTDLTEKLKKGELPKMDIHYYIKSRPYGKIKIDRKEAIGWAIHATRNVEQILASVPSYEEYLALQSDSLAKNEAVEINAELENSIKDLKHRNENLRLALKTYEFPEIQKILTDWRTGELDKKFNKFEKENAKLKELLNRIKHQCELLVPKNGLNPVSEKSILCKTFLNLIDEVLK